MVSHYPIAGLLAEKYRGTTKRENIYMKLLVVKGHTTHHWRCAHCGRTADSSVKPGMTYGGSCRMSRNGMHRWVKER